MRNGTTKALPLQHVPLRAYLVYKAGVTSEACVHVPLCIRPAWFPALRAHHRLDLPRSWWGNRAVEDTVPNMQLA